MTDSLASRKTLAASLVLAVTFCSLMAAALFAPVKASAAGCTSGSLIKGTLPAVYYCGADGKRYVFTNDKAYWTWYADFSGVTTISDSALASVQIGGNVTYRPGRKMIKIQSDPKVYVIAHGGSLRPIASEAVASCLYGSNWNTQIDDISDAFFVNYDMGSTVSACADFDKTAELNLSQSINSDMSLTVGAGALSVSSTTPGNGANGSISSDLSATFNGSLDASSLNSTTFTLKKAGSSSNVAGTVSVSGSTATFHPSASLEAGATYTATLTTGAKSLGGVALSSNYSWTFTATASGSGTAPAVTSTSPTHASVSASAGGDLTATFSGAMDASTLNGTTFTLKKSASGSANLAGTVTYSGNTATFNPAADLEAGAAYTATVTTGAKSQSGAALSADYSWTFTVAAASDVTAPTVTAISPPDGAMNVAAGTEISATFSEAMNASTLNVGSFTVMKGSTGVTGAVTYSGNKVTFTPTVALEANTTYTAKVDSTAKDLNGNLLMGGAYSWTFKTAL